MNVDCLPSMLHSIMRSLGWSVKKTFPSASHVGPSVNSKPPASFFRVWPGAILLSVLLSAARKVVLKKQPKMRVVAKRGITTEGLGLVAFIGSTANSKQGLE